MLPCYVWLIEPMLTKVRMSGSTYGSHIECGSADGTAVATRGK